jgi:uncharacterized protein (TIRG00374 family)
MKKVIRFVLIFCVGCLLIYLSVRKLELQALVDIIKGANYLVVVPVFLISITGYWFRSLRWQIILQAMGRSVKPFHLFSSLSMGYAVNIVTPRLGEIVRCIVLRKTDLVPVEQSLVSVVVERVIDFICLFSVLLLATVLSFGSVRLFMTNNIIEPLVHKWMQLPFGWLLTGVIALAIVGYVVLKKMKVNSRMERLSGSIIESVKQVIHLKQPLPFIVYTILIWICYFLMTYLWFYMFAETAELGLKEALVIMAIGSVGRSVPVQGGGMGAYHFLVSNAFTLFGVSLLMGNAMAFIIHGAQLLLTFVLGIGCWVWMLFYIKRSR